MEALVKELGFESLSEYHRLVANIDISTKEKLKDFENWKENDGTKQGLLNLNETP